MWISVCTPGNDPTFWDIFWHPRWDSHSGFAPFILLLLTGGDKDQVGLQCALTYWWGTPLAPLPLSGSKWQNDATCSRGIWKEVREGEGKVPWDADGIWALHNSIKTMHSSTVYLFLCVDVCQREGPFAGEESELSIWNTGLRCQHHLALRNRPRIKQQHFLFFKIWVFICFDRSSREWGEWKSRVI